MDIQLTDSPGSSTTFRGTRASGPGGARDLGPVGVVLSVIGLLFLGLPVAALLARAVLSGELLEQAGERAVLDALVL
ncbi:MAG: hypothetical protein ABWZ82_08865, partial [Candidatus Limnocylindrales bacterium]